MHTVRMEQRFTASPERVFALMTDHVAFGRAVDADIRIEREGTPAPNGLGAVRVVRAKGTTTREEVVRWEAPRSMHYKIVGASPLRDHLGMVEVLPDGAGSRVDYQIRFRVPWYLGGALTGSLVSSLLQRQIGAGLARMAQELR